MSTPDDLDELRARIEDLTRTVAEVVESFGAQDDRRAHEFESLRQFGEGLGARLAQIERRLDHLETDLAHLERERAR